MADINPNTGGPQRSQEEAHEGEFCEIQSATGEQESSLGQEVREAASQVLEQGRQMASDVTERSKGKAGELADQIQAKLYDLLERQKHMAADRIGAIGKALRDVSSSLTEENRKGVAPFADRTADSIERISHDLHERDLRELVDRAEGFARRQPELLLGASFLGGVLLARFLKTTWSHGSREVSEPAELAVGQTSHRPAHGAWESETPDIEGRRSGTRDYSVNDPVTDANVDESSTGEPDDAQL